MHIQDISSKELWNGFVVSATNDTFHQSWEWGETNLRRGNRVWYLGLVDENNHLIAAFLTIKISARRGSFLLVPHGPLFSASLKENPTHLATALKTISHYLKKLGRDEHCVCVRLAPTLERNQENLALFHSAGYRNAPMFVQSELSWRLPLTPPEEDLLTNMRKSTRYILKRSDAYGLSFSSSSSIEDFDRFYALYAETVKNQEFVGQSQAFIKEEFSVFVSSGSARLYFAQSNEGGVDLATAMIITQGSTGFYHYGASRKDERNTPAPHLLQWNIIKDLKARGYTYYNFWGISEDDKPNHPWRGLTVFKKGFGGEELAYLKTQDLIISPLYWIGWCIETLRRIKRHY